MNHIAENQLIDENALAKDFYFQSLFLAAAKKGLLSEGQIERIQLELVELMGKEIERYTNDESSSVKVEKAQDILQSVTYNIGLYLKSNTVMTQKLTILKESKISDMFYHGMEAAAACRARAELLLKDLHNHCLKLTNYAYQDTIFTGLPEFFRSYNIEFEAHEIPASFDYPLCSTNITGLLGVEYIEEYLNILTKEDKFLRHFSDEDINGLLDSFDKESEHILINIFEVVFINALACTFLGHKITELKISTDDLRYLQNKLYGMNKEELEKQLISMLRIINQELSLEREVTDYAEAAIPILIDRLAFNLETGTLDKFFTEYPKERKQNEEMTVEEGAMMPDDKLRELIESIKACDNTEEKIALMKAQVRSMADFSDLIEECFYEEEYDKVFLALNENDKAVLKNLIQAKAGPEFDENYEGYMLWQKKFLKTVNT